MKVSPAFSLWTDKSADISDYAVLLVFISYVQETNFEEGMLLCQSLLSHTSGEEIFQLSDLFMEEHKIQL